MGWLCELNSVLFFFVVLLETTRGLDPINDLGKDLACSACTLTANTIEREVLQLSVGKKKKKKKNQLSKRLGKALHSHCDGLKNMATIGDMGSREYVDLVVVILDIRVLNSSYNDTIRQWRLAKSLPAGSLRMSMCVLCMWCMFCAHVHAHVC
jgi:hypothetical protein